jgi:homoserine kinase type II
MADKYLSRINYSQDLTPLLQQVAESFGVGAYQAHHVIPVGYEDLNVRLDTTRGSYFVKLFARSRLSSDIVRYVSIIEKVMAAGVRHPRLLADNIGEHLHYLADGKVSLVVMEWIDGESYWDAGLKPSDPEVTELVATAARINQLPFCPEFSYDSWAINNFEHEYERFQQHLSSEDRPLVADVLIAYRAIDHAHLPHGLVHGDLISTNVLRTKRGLYVVDFSVANYLPRVQELAVLMSDLLFDETDPVRTRASYQRALNDYQADLTLEPAELLALPTYVRAAHAMHVLSTSKLIARGEDDAENQHWLRLGRAGLRQTIV